MFMSKKIFHQSIACLPVIFAQLLIGIGWGWVAPTLEKLQRNNSEFKITTNEASLLGSIGEVGRFLGPFISPFLLETIGRKNTITITIIIYIIVWSTLIFARHIYVISAIRILFGISNGMNDVSTTVYTAENCSPNFRAIIGSVVQLTFNVGLILELVITTYMSFTNAAIVNTLVSIFAFTSLYFSLETPYWLVLKGKQEKASKNLTWLRSGVDQNNINNELEKIKKNVEEEKEKTQSLRLLLTSKTNFKSLFTVMGFFFLGGATGFHVVIPYSSMIFVQSNVFTSNEYSIILSIIMFLGTFISPFIIERFNRRTLLITSFLFYTFSNVCTSTLLYLRDADYEVPHFPWFLFISVAMYGFMGSLTSGASYAVLGELLPLSIRAIGGSIAITINSMVSFGSCLAFWSITEIFGMGTNFLIYAFSCLFASIFLYIFLPETKGKALHELHKKTIHTEHL